MAWKLREAKIRLHALEYTVGAGSRVALLYGLDFIHPMLASVLLRHLEQLGLVAALGDDKSHSLHLTVGLLRHDNLVIFHAETLGYLGHGITQQLRH